MSSDFNFYRSLVKPGFDFLFSLVLSLVLFPLLLVVVGILLIHFLGNPIFVQKRIGKNGRIFNLIKFKSLRNSEQLHSATRLGRLIRITSLDELPQLFNVLKGQMSLVGPRPLLPEYAEYYNDEEKKRHLVKPGITGLAQIRVGNTNEWERRMKLDVEYVERQSFLLDLKILFGTVRILMKFKQKKTQDVEIMKFSDYAANR